MLEQVVRDLKTIIATVFLYSCVKQLLQLYSCVKVDKNVEDVKKTKIKLLEMRTTMTYMKNSRIGLTLD